MVLEQARSAANMGRYVKHRLAPKASYAADREDIAANLLLGRVTRFIDVGANDGVTLSNTALLALQGARGLCFEPNPPDFGRLRAFYLLTSRVECFEQGISDRSGALELRSDGLLSAMPSTEDAALTKLLTPFYSTHSSRVAVTVERLATWFERRPEYVGCDVLSIDVEGHELNVLLGIDWERHENPARCIILETHSSNVPGEQVWLHRDYDAIGDLLTRNGYCKLVASANNTFWLRNDELDQARISSARESLPGYRWFDDAI